MPVDTLASNKITPVCVCVSTSAQHRQDEQKQVGLATGAEHAGKHQEDPTPAEGRPGGGQHTQSWKTQRRVVCVYLCVHTENGQVHV